MPSWAGMVGVAHLRAPRVSRNSGIMRKSNVSSDHVLAPMCVDPPSLHMGTQPPYTTLIGKDRDSNKKQPPPRKGPGLPCATPKTTTPPSRNRTDLDTASTPPQTQRINTSPHTPTPHTRTEIPRIESAHHACPPPDQRLDPPVASIVCPVIHRAASLAR